MYLETSMSSRTTSKSNSSNTSCERARDKVRRRRRFISPNNSFTTLISGTVEHNREHPQELLLRVLQRTKPCGTWCSSAQRENSNHFTFSCFNYVTKIRRRTSLALTGQLDRHDQRSNTGTWNYVTRIRFCFL